MRNLGIFKNKNTHLILVYFCRMIFTDTHTHLYAEEFNDDRDAMIQRAIARGVERMFMPNIDSGSIESMLSLTQQYPGNCFAMMGLHPCSVKENYEQELEIIEKQLKNGTFYAVGEIGIDLFWDTAFFEQQQIAFKKQIEWALELSLPIVIHSRKSFEEIYTILKPYKGSGLRGIFHCFSGNLEQAKRIIDLGFFLGIGGVITFKNAGLAEVVAQIELKHLVLETDSPYLAPVPYRGKRNESAYMELVAQKLAEVKACSLEEVAEVTTRNSINLFGR
jgi:TatD DNase family protein